GTFNSVSNSSKKVFTYKDYFTIEEKLYFRVKIFDLLTDEKNWLSSNKKKNDNKYKNTFVPFGEKGKKYQGKLILEPNNKNWIPSLKDTKILDNVTNFDNLNLVFSSNSKIIDKEIYTSIYFPSIMDLSSGLQSYYTSLPKTINNELINWAKKTYANSKNDNDYIKKILKEFSSGKFYYSLKPANYGNNYSKFFLETKEGYCEYYSGTLAILTRSVGIPSRIVTGFFGGEYNDYGKFFNFNQSDAHAWVEVWFKNKGWIRIDPTAFIPSENIKDSNNYFLRENLSNQSNNFLFSKTLRKFYNYARYLDYKWTNTFIQYDQKSRNKVIKKFGKTKIFFLFKTLILCL
ncbi:transglutaminase-like domain-containing protein, partial [Pelagibacteraceae bacterium]|nr:transglutaminase-like domain-containing protein [Pelagibacteraceae bacterium]